MERSPAVANGSPTRVHETLVHHHPVVDDYAARPARSVEPLYGMERDSIDRRADADTVQVSQTDVMDWTRRGVREDVIIDRIERNNARFKLSATDQNRLRDAGVSEEVIRTMCDSARR